MIQIVPGNNVIQVLDWMVKINQRPHQYRFLVSISGVPRQIGFTATSEKNAYGMILERWRDGSVMTPKLSAQQRFSMFWKMTENIESSTA